MPVLIVGLGNPGPRYGGNRHNIGFRVVEALAAHLGVSWATRDPRFREARHDDAVLLEPLTYMNRSGDAVRAWYDQAPDGADAPLVVVCDDLHLPLGSLRLRNGGSAGGQNGLASILAALGHDAVPRLRLGVGPRDAPVPPEDWADYVLDDFPPDEADAVADLVGRAVAALVDVLAVGPDGAGSRHNRTIRREPDLPAAD